MHITVVTLFPEMFLGVFDISIIKRAQTKKILTLDFLNIRDSAKDRYKTVDGNSYGGGLGMILRVDIVDRAIQKAKSQIPQAKTKTILLDPQGTPYTQHKAAHLRTVDHLILVCGHYEGIDERIRSLVDEEISIGDYILTGGEIPAMVLIDSITRLLPGVFKEGVTDSESFSKPFPLLEYPQYTAPRSYKGKPVPPILLSGHHANIKAWRTKEAKKRTKLRRPDILNS